MPFELVGESNKCALPGAPKKGRSFERPLAI
jgi:hypothetical protein